MQKNKVLWLTMAALTYSLLQVSASRSCCIFT